MQSPASTFQVPIESDKIAILAVSERYPTYYDLCVADSACKTTCYSATNTFPGISHSGDKNEGTDLLHYMKISEQLQSGKEFAVFVSGFQLSTPFAPMVSRRISYICITSKAASEHLMVWSNNTDHFLHRCTKLTRFQARNPVVMVANHADQVGPAFPFPEKYA